MSRVIDKPTIVRAAGSPPKEIQEFIGRVNSSTDALSIAKMISPPGWSEAGQTPEFAEYTLVLKGALYVEDESGIFIVKEGQAFIAEPGEWIRYSTPEGAEYIAVCLPAFSPKNVHRDLK
ncbi:MAG: cupin [Lentisphaerae bacterium GWF2_44_16]|nr:MAG: cupin [Lentisphaerae bacterium GWF2_44_16]